MAPVEAEDAMAEAASQQIVPQAPPKAAGPRAGMVPEADVEEWVNNVDEVTAQVKGLIDGTITDFEAFDRQLELKARAKEIREEEAQARREKFYLQGIEGKGEGTRYKWWCKRCFVEYLIDLPEGRCTRCGQGDKVMTQAARREELMGKVEVFKEERAQHQWRKDKWLRWKKSQALLGRSRNINYKAWEYWEPDTDSENEGEPIVPRDNPEFLAMEADMKQRHKKLNEKAQTAEKCRERGNRSLKEGDYVGAIEHYEEGLEYKKDSKALWTNKALAELKVFRWHDAIMSCNRVIEYAEIFEDCFTKSRDACFKAFLRRAVALRALHRWREAAEDLEDALRLFPKDPEARDLLAKTKAAEEEAQQVQQLQQAQKEGREGGEPTAPAPPGPEPKPEAAAPAAPAPAPPGAAASGGAVRVAIEVSDEEDEEEGVEVAAAPPACRGPPTGSLAALSRGDFQALLKRLEGSQSERMLFCARQGEASSLSKHEGRKINIQVEEVAGPSALDQLLKDAERCCVLWRKFHQRPQGAAKVIHGGYEHEEEEKEADSFLKCAAPRILKVLHVLAASSDHHCALTAPAVRHVWPLASSAEWRLAVLELLFQWSQRAISGKAMVEFAGRYPDPHLKVLIEAATQESEKERLLLSATEQVTQAGSGPNGQDWQKALDGMLEEYSALQGSAELAVAVLGNLCSAGAGGSKKNMVSSSFQEQLAEHCDTLLRALARQLRQPFPPYGGRLCARAAGALCNVLRLGEPFVSAAHTHCMEPLMKALRGGDRAEEGPSAFAELLCSGSAPAGASAYVEDARAKMLGALVNLLVLRPSAVQQALDFGMLDLAISLIDPDVDVAAAAEMAGEEDAPEASVSAELLACRLLAGAAAASGAGRLGASAEAELLRRLFRILGRADAAGVRVPDDVSLLRSSSSASAQLEQLERVVRMLAVIVTRTPGGLDRLVERRPRVEEVVTDSSEQGNPAAAATPAVPFGTLTDMLIRLALAVQPASHVGPDDEGGLLSRMRGNLALLFGSLCEAQAAEEGVPPLLRELNLQQLVAPFVECLRRERGSAQNNVGVFVTRLAQNPRYRQLVRDLRGIETLHQIQLPRVEAQKAEAAKQHRLETSVEARRAELMRRQQQQQQQKC